MYSKQQKEKALNLYKETHSVSETVRILGYPTRKNLYNWIYETHNHESKYTDLRIKINSLFDENKKRYGYRRIHALLKEKG